MKKFLVRVSVFFVLVFFCDHLVGFVLYELLCNVKSGSFVAVKKVSEGVDADIVVMGSSRAQHHYDPRVIQDTLEMSCYNVGKDGSGILLMYGRYRMLKRKHIPRYVLYDVNGFDFGKFKGDYNFLYGLRPYWGEDPVVDSLICLYDKTERLKNFALCHRFNRGLFTLLGGNYVPVVVDGANGFIPNSWDMKHDIAVSQIDPPTVVDSFRIRCLERFLMDCEGKTQVIFYVSPYYKRTSDKDFSPVVELARKYKVPFINHCSDTAFVWHQEYFCDATHLNHRGAAAYSKVVASELKEMLKKDVVQ